MGFLRVERRPARSFRVLCRLGAGVGSVLLPGRFLQQQQAAALFRIASASLHGGTW